MHAMCIMHLTTTSSSLTTLLPPTHLQNTRNNNDKHVRTITDMFMTTHLSSSTTTNSHVLSAPMANHHRSLPPDARLRAESKLQVLNKNNRQTFITWPELFFAQALLLTKPLTHDLATADPYPSQPDPPQPQHLLKLLQLHPLRRFPLQMHLRTTMLSLQWTLMFSHPPMPDEDDEMNPNFPARADAHEDAPGVPLATPGANEAENATKDLVCRVCC